MYYWDLIVEYKEVMNDIARFGYITITMAIPSARHTSAGASSGFEDGDGESIFG